MTALIGPEIRWSLVRVQPTPRNVVCWWDRKVDAGHLSLAGSSRRTADEYFEELADVVIGFGRVPERRPPVDRIGVATAVALSAQVTALLEVGNDLLDGALSDPDLLRDI